MINVRVKITGIRQLQRKLTTTARKLKNKTAANRDVSKYLMRWVKENFRTEGGKVGGWAPLKAGGRWKRRRGRRYLNTRAKILVDTGSLRASFKSFYNNRFATVKSIGVKYAKYHEFGVPSNNLPQRRMLPTNRDREVIKGVTQIYNTHIKRALK